MSYNIELYEEKQLSDIVKYRGDISGKMLFKANIVNNSSFVNKNLFCDNTVTINCTTPTVVPTVNIPAEEIANRTNVIKLLWSTYTVIGFVTDWEYINDNNIRIGYRVDAFMSALLSNKIDSLEGICERTNLDYSPDRMFVNLQPEPFTPSDISVYDRSLTDQINTKITAFEGGTIGGSGISGAGFVFILTVSPVIASYYGDVAPFFKPTDIATGLKRVHNLNFAVNNTTLHSGGYYRGTPLMFNSMEALLQAIRNITTGCGFITSMPADGYEGQNSVTSRIQSVNNYGQVIQSHKNWNKDPIETLRFIDGSDLYNVYCIPKEFAVNQSDYFEAVIELENLKTVNNLTSFGAELHNKNKLTAHPYKYYKLLTANGDYITLYPQQHCMRDETNPFSFSNKAFLTLRYIGGDTPRLMGKLSPSNDNTYDSYGLDTANEWFTIRSYPSITISYQNDYNPQIQREITTIRRLTGTYINSVNSARLSSPLRRGYIDTIMGDPYNTNNMGLLGSALYRITHNIARFDKAHGYSGPGFDNEVLQDAQNALQEANFGSGSVIKADLGVLTGNDFLHQLSVGYTTVYECGSTDSELFTYARYLDKFGETCNCPINPLTNLGNIFGGYATVRKEKSGGLDRTFYKYTDIVVTGDMPNEWKSNIKKLFESGVYLLDRV